MVNSTTFNYSTTMWVYILGPSSASYANIFRYGSAPETRSPALWIKSNTLVWALNTKAKPLLEIASKTIPAASWIHTALTVTHTTAKMYVDGLLVETKNLTADGNRQLSVDQELFVSDPGILAGTTTPVLPGSIPHGSSVCECPVGECLPWIV